MMKTINILAFILLWSNGVSSQTLFKIITFSDGVKIDGKAISVGDEITNQSKKIVIPAKGYIGVVTADGYAYEIQNSIAVADVNPLVKSRHVTVDGKPELMLDLSIPTTESILLGDSLFVNWKETEEVDTIPGENYRIRLVDSNQNIISQESQEHNWIVLNMQSMLSSSKLIEMRIRSENTGVSCSVTAGRDDHNKIDMKKLSNDIKRLGNNPELSMLCALYDIYNAQHDRNFILYKMITQKVQTQGFLSGYTTKLTSKIKLK